eukprot:4450555-Pyramimonas_sp.AAC.1
MKNLQTSRYYEPKLSRSRSRSPRTPPAAARAPGWRCAHSVLLAPGPPAPPPPTARRARGCPDR